MAERGHPINTQKGNTPASFSFFFRDRCSTMELQLPRKYLEVASFVQSTKSAKVQGDGTYLHNRKGHWLASDTEGRVVDVLSGKK